MRLKQLEKTSNFTQSFTEIYKTNNVAFHGHISKFSFNHPPQASLEMSRLYLLAPLAPAPHSTGTLLLCAKEARASRHGRHALDPAAVCVVRAWSKYSSIKGESLTRSHDSAPAPDAVPAA